MKWNKNQLEDFFGATFIPAGPFLEMKFESGGLRYRIRFEEGANMIILKADARNPDSSYPALEIEITCQLITIGEAVGIGPVLYFYSSSECKPDEISVCITRTKDGVFSISLNI